MIIDTQKNWNSLSEKDKENVYNSYKGIQNPILRKDIELLYGKENLNEYQKLTHENTRKNNK